MGAPIFAYAAGPLRLWFAFAFLFVTAAAHAQTPGAEDPQSFVKDTTEEVLQTLRSQRADLEKNPKKLYRIVDEIIVPHFDFQRMAQLALGKNWRMTSDVQKQRFVEEFRTLMVRTYSTSMLQYVDDTFSYPPSHTAGDTRKAVVEMTVSRKTGGPPISMRLRVRAAGDTWKVYDVIVDGVSLVVNYRQSFDQDIRTVGMDGLIDKLVQKNKGIGS